MGAGMGMKVNNLGIRGNRIQKDIFTHVYAEDAIFRKRQHGAMLPDKVDLLPLGSLVSRCRQLAWRLGVQLAGKAPYFLKRGT